MKKLTKAETKRLVICRERAFDLLYRCEELADILARREWPEYESVIIESRHVAELHRLLESCEKKVFEANRENAS